MIVVMQPDASEDQITQVAEYVQENGLKAQIIRGSELSVVAVIGDDRKKDRNVYETLSGVDKVVPILAPYKLASREIKKETTVVEISQNCRVGDKTLLPIAGPCSVESQEQIIEIAKAVKRAGATALRGGAFKPRTNPYSFQGLGKRGLEFLADARRETGLPVVTEVLSPEDVELVAEYADCLQVGTRNAQNFKLLEACGKQPKPILFKRGLANTLEEYLQAAEYILDAGNPNIILCERGIRTFETHGRNTLSLSAVADLKHRSHLPVIVDPSQGTGQAHLVPPMCYAAVASGADGLIIEVHTDPSHALTDGAQSIVPDELADIIERIGGIAQAIGRHD